MCEHKTPKGTCCFYFEPSKPSFLGNALVILPAIAITAVWIIVDYLTKEDDYSDKD